MVPVSRLLEEAAKHEVDIISLSGLITPSLEEMGHMAAELEREGIDLPLLIGGATTSKVHTAVKIEPHYKRGPVIHVTDASRAVGVVSNLLNKDARDEYASAIAEEYARIRVNHAGRRASRRRFQMSRASKSLRNMTCRGSAGILTGRRFSRLGN